MAGSSMSVSLADQVRIKCLTFRGAPDAGPILSLDFGGLLMSVHSRYGAGVEAADVENARALVAAAGRFLAEVERMHAASIAAERAAAESERSA